MEDIRLDLLYSCSVSDIENVTINQRASYPSTKVTTSLQDLSDGGLFYCIIGLAVNISFGIELQLEDSQR